MAEFLGVVKLGTLYYKNDGKPKALKNPKNPVNRITRWSNDPELDKVDEINTFTYGKGDINSAESNYDSIYDEYYIGDTSLNKDEQLSWVKIRDKNKILYICDRVILDHLEPRHNIDELTQSREIIIDNNKYTCRSIKLCMAERRSDPNSESSSATICVKCPRYYDPKTEKYYYCEDEWADYILNKKGIKGLPIPQKYDLHENVDVEKAYNGEHNKLWHWFGVETSTPIRNPSGWHGSETYNIACGGRGADYWRGDRWDFGYYEWRPVLEYLKPAPTISDTDRNLGDKNKGFSISYTVSDMDTVKVTEKLNGTVIKTINNAPQNEELSINIDKETLYKLPLNSESKITIEVDDGYGGISYRNYTFTRTNTAPIINDQDKNLGLVDRTVKQSYRVHDEENDSINIIESLDDIKLKSFKAESSKEYEISIPTSTWITLKNGQHKLTVNATDSNNATSIRTYIFEKKETKINLSLKNVLKIDDRANKILITPVWKNIDLANVKVEVCNNALDTNPTWEECTKEVMSNKHYAFNNKNKTADKWGINIRFNIEKKKGVTEEIYFNGFGGAFE